MNITVLKAESYLIFVASIPIIIHIYIYIEPTCKFEKTQRLPNVWSRKFIGKISNLKNGKKL
jgi:hypothetical protein